MIIDFFVVFGFCESVVLVFGFKVVFYVNDFLFSFWYKGWLLCLVVGLIEIE